jgi:hypothetical protein
MNSSLSCARRERVNSGCAPTFDCCRPGSCQARNSRRPAPNTARGCRRPVSSSNSGCRPLRAPRPTWMNGGYPPAASVCIRDPGHPRYWFLLRPARLRAATRPSAIRSSIVGEVTNIVLSGSGTPGAFVSSSSLGLLALSRAHTAHHSSARLLHRCRR